jgi:hypothetical protein
LHLTICEAKFHEKPVRNEVQGSPILATTAHKVFDLLISEAPTEKQSIDWTNHRQLGTNYMIYPSVIRICRDYFSKNDLTDGQKQKFIHDVAAPYLVPEPLIKSILTELKTDIA